MPPPRTSAGATATPAATSTRHGSEDGAFGLGLGDAGKQWRLIAQIDHLEQVAGMHVECNARFRAAKTGQHEG